VLGGEEKRKRSRDGGEGEGIKEEKYNTSDSKRTELI
jgi:hypothetical protein